MEIKVLNFQQLILNTIIFNKININGVQFNSHRVIFQILPVFYDINNERSDAVYYIPVNSN